MILLLWLGICQNDPSVPAKPVSLPDLEAVAKAYDAAISRRDLVGLGKILAPDVVFTTATGRVMERAAVLEMLGNPDTHYETVESSDVVRRISGNVVIETGRVKIVGKRKGNRVDEIQRYTDIWQKQEGGWRLIAEHTSLVPSGQK